MPTTDRALADVRRGPRWRDARPCATHRMIPTCADVRGSFSSSHARGCRRMFVVGVITMYVVGVVTDHLNTTSQTNRSCHWQIGSPIALHGVGENTKREP